MTDTNTTDTTQQNEETLKKMLHDLYNQSAQLAEHVVMINNTINAGLYKHLSKDSRNSILSKLDECVDQIDETARVVYKNLKRIKRERPTDELVDNVMKTAAKNFKQ